MKKHIVAITVFLAAGLQLTAQSSEVIRNYISRFKDIAMEEMQRTGVPASITLAQGIHETGAGTSMLVTKSNNHFGIKCKTEWTGEKVYHDDDARGECFRKYEDPIQSYRDHSDFLKLRPYYTALFKLDPLDYKGWAHGLKKAGYATNPRYAYILIKLIEDYNLQDYSLIALNMKKPEGNDVIWASNTTVVSSETEQNAKVEKKDLRQSYPAGVFRINETKVILVTEGTSYLKIAQEHNLSLSRLFEFNDMKEEDIASRDRLIFLQRKRKQGPTDYHIVAEGETMYDIAQSEGIRLDVLMDYNLMQGGMEPAAGEKIHLKGMASSTPRLRGSEEKKEITPAPAFAVKEEDNFITHTVQTKETAYAISKKYGVTVEELKEWNSLSSTDLRVGQELRIKKK